MVEIPSEGTYILYVDNNDGTITMHFRYEEVEASVLMNLDLNAMISAMLQDEELQNRIRAAAGTENVETILIPNEVDFDA